MLKVALLYTGKSESERDLGKMIMCLEGVLKETDGIEITSVELDPVTVPDYTVYGHLVFCGYDHITLAHLHLALETTSPTTTRITLYDEPGASIERELNTLLFRGVDVNSRIPAGSVTRLTHSWSHRDILAVCKQDVLKYTNEDTRSAGKDSSPQPVKPVSRTRSGSTRARQVAGKGAAPARERDGDTEGGGGDGSGDN